MSPSKLAVALFIIVSTLSGFFVGMLLSPLFIPENSGLVAGALVLWYGVIGLVIGLVTSLIGWRYLSSFQIKIVNWVLGVFALGMIAWLVYRIASNYNEARSSYMPPPETTKPAPPLDQPEAPLPEDPQPPVAEGLGMGMPQLTPDQPIYFYQQPDDEQPSDSLILTEGPHHLIVSEASSVFRPEVMKPDYQRCYFLIKKSAGPYFQVVIDRQSGQTAWVRTEMMDLLDWPHFYTSMHSVEARNWADTPVRTSPNDEADPMKGVDQNHILQAKAASGDWLNVEVFTEDYQSLGKGWIRWRKNGKLTLNYNLLS